MDRVYTGGLALGPNASLAYPAGVASAVRRFTLCESINAACAGSTSHRCSFGTLACPGLAGGMPVFPPSLMAGLHTSQTASLSFKVGPPSAVASTSEQAAVAH